MDNDINLPPKRFLKLKCFLVECLKCLFHWCVLPLKQSDCPAWWLVHAILATTLAFGPDLGRCASSFKYLLIPKIHHQFYISIKPRTSLAINKHICFYYGNLARANLAQWRGGRELFKSYNIVLLIL